jgi:hypothetical protein
MPDANGKDTPLGRIGEGTEVIAASLASGRKLLATVDAFVTHQSRFDRQARLNLAHDVMAVNRAAYLNYVTAQVMEWSTVEIAALKDIMASISAKFAALDVPLPGTVYLVKTSGQEEGYAAYTRAENIIVLPANMVASLQTGVNFGDPLHPGDNASYLKDIIIHEFFHIFSKNNTARRFELYALLHYSSTGAAVELPEVPWQGTALLTDLKITNPDTPELNVFIEMKVPPPNAGAVDGVVTPLLPVLLADRPYDGGVFFDYLGWWFFAIEKNRDGRWSVSLTADGKPVAYESGPLKEQYLDLVGHNFRQEIFHPDEILAQSFVLTANQPSMGLLTTIRDSLQSTRS